MTSLTRGVVASLLSMAVASTAVAQDGGFFKRPIFIAQPGVVTVNAISPTNETAEARHGFNVRFATAIPTRSPYLTLIAGTQFQPNGIGGNRQNQPGFFYGGIIPVAFIGTVTGGWLTMSVDPLGVYAAGLGGSSTRPYGHDFFIEGAFVLNVGSKMMSNMGPWSGLGVYFLVDQQITHPAKDSNNDSDFWNPTLLYGVTLPLAPWGQ